MDDKHIIIAYVLTNLHSYEKKTESGFTINILFYIVVHYCTLLYGLDYVHLE